VPSLLCCVLISLGSSRCSGTPASKSCRFSSGVSHSGRAQGLARRGIWPPWSTRRWVEPSWASQRPPGNSTFPVAAAIHTGLLCLAVNGDAAAAGGSHVARNRGRCLVKHNSRAPRRIMELRERRRTQTDTYCSNPMIPPPNTSP
jgi:hypothetical protein